MELKFLLAATMHIFDLLVFLAYMLMLLVVGVWFYRRNQSSSAFTLGDNNIPTWVISLSLFATFVSSISYLALPGIAYQQNWNSFVFSLSLPIAAIMAVKYFVPQFRQINSPSAYTFLEIRFGAWARTYAASMYLLTQIMRVGTILFLMALVPNTMFGWDIVTLIIATSVLIAVYSMLGGIQAVVWTDAIQAIILIVGAIVCVVLVAFKMPDGLAGIVSMGVDQKKFSLGSFGFDLSEQSFWVVLLYGIFINLQNFGADQNYIQRYMTSKSLGAAQKSAFWGAMLYVPASMIFLFIGTSLFALYQSGTAVLPKELQGLQNSDRVFPYFIVHELPVGVTGLLIASIFAAGMSTISTSYNSSATVILTDFYQKYAGKGASEKRKLMVLHLSTVAISLLGMIVAIAMINTKSVLDTWWKLASVFSGGILGLFLLAMFSKIESNKAVIIGVVAGLAVIIFMTVSNLYLPPDALGNQFHPYLSIVFGTSAIFIVGLLLGIGLKKKSV
jgi:solute:Na+ symporter, SSS family